MRACIGAMMYCAGNEQKMKHMQTVNEWNDPGSSFVFEFELDEFEMGGQFAGTFRRDNFRTCIYVVHCHSC